MSKTIGEYIAEINEEIKTTIRTNPESLCRAKEKQFPNKDGYLTATKTVDGIIWNALQPLSSMFAEQRMTMLDANGLGSTVKTRTNFAVDVVLASEGENRHPLVSIAKALSIDSLNPNMALSGSARRHRILVLGYTMGFIDVGEEKRRGVVGVTLLNESSADMTEEEIVEKTRKELYSFAIPELKLPLKAIDDACANISEADTANLAHALAIAFPAARSLEVLLDQKWRKDALETIQKCKAEADNTNQYVVERGYFAAIQQLGRADRVVFQNTSSVLAVGVRFRTPADDKVFVLRPGEIAVIDDKAVVECLNRAAVSRDMEGVNDFDYLELSPDFDDAEADTIVAQSFALYDRACEGRVQIAESSDFRFTLAKISKRERRNGRLTVKVENKRKVPLLFKNDMFDERKARLDNMSVIITVGADSGEFVPAHANLICKATDEAHNQLLNKAKAVLDAKN